MTTQQRKWPQNENRYCRSTKHASCVQGCRWTLTRPIDSTLSPSMWRLLIFDPPTFCDEFHFMMLSIVAAEHEIIFMFFSSASLHSSVLKAQSECFQASWFHTGYNSQATSSCVCSCPVLRLPRYIIQNQLKNISKKINTVHCAGCKVVYEGREMGFCMVVFVRLAYFS